MSFLKQNKDSSSDQIAISDNEQPGVPQKGESKIAVIAAVVGNIAVGIVKFIAAGISGSSAMVSEGIHSIVDSGNGLLILYGLSRASKPADEEHPFGYGKELYFWTMVVSILIFALGGGMSIIEGTRSFIEAVGGHYTFGNPTVSYVVIAAGALIEGATLFVALKQFNLARGDVSPHEFIRDAKDPSLYSVVLEDSAAEAGLVFAFLGILLTDITGIPYFDCAASILIGLLLVVVSIILLTESKGLLVGEGMKHEELLKIREIVEAHPDVIACGRILTMYFGPDSVLISIDVSFFINCTAFQIRAAIGEIEDEVRKAFPEAKSVFIEEASPMETIQQRQSLSADDDKVFAEDFEKDDEELDEFDDLAEKLYAEDPVDFNIRASEVSEATKILIQSNAPIEEIEEQMGEILD